MALRDSSLHVQRLETLDTLLLEEGTMIIALHSCLDCLWVLKIPKDNSVQFLESNLCLGVLGAGLLHVIH